MLKAKAALIDSIIAGVPPSSLASISDIYSCPPEYTCANKVAMFRSCAHYAVTIRTQLLISIEASRKTMGLCDIPRYACNAMVILVLKLFF